MTNTTNTRPDHVVFDFKRNEMACRHCGAAQIVVMPIDVTVLVLKSNAYLEQHEGCPPPPAPADDEGEAAFLDAAAKDCRSCSCCQQVPCGGCQQGSVCDAFDCMRGDHEGQFDDGEEDAEDYA